MEFLKQLTTLSDDGGDGEEEAVVTVKEETEDVVMRTENHDASRVAEMDCDLYEEASPEAQNMVHNAVTAATKTMEPAVMPMMERRPKVEALSANLLSG